MKFWEAETLFRLKRYAEAAAVYDAVVEANAASPLAADAMYGRAWSELEVKRTSVRGYTWATFATCAEGARVTDQTGNTFEGPVTTCP